MSIQIIACPICGNNITADADTCMYCGEKVALPVEQVEAKVNFEADAEVEAEPQVNKRPGIITILAL